MSIIEIVPINANKISTSTQIGPKRKNNTTYAFQNMHPLHLTHHQKIRSKLLIPLLVGGSPMNFNAIDDNNEHRICIQTSMDFTLIYFTLLKSEKLKAKSEKRK